MLASFKRYTAWLMWATLLLGSDTLVAEAINPQAVIMQKAINLKMDNLEYLNSGVYGKLGANVMYFVHKTQLHNLDEFYATMVRVLSVKYGCFMRSREKSENTYAFKCKDGRKINIRHGQSGDTYYFVGKQFNRKGDEIIILSSNAIAALSN